MAKNNTRQSAQNTSSEEIEAAAKKAGLFTTAMIAAKLDLNENTVRNRIKARAVQPSAKIHPKARGRASLAYSKEVVEKIAAETGEVRVEMLGTAR